MTDLRDPDIRAELREWARDMFPDDLHLEEFAFGMGTIADYLVVRDDAMIGFEIKSDVDSLQRLKTQARHYSLVCNSVSLVTTAKYANAALRRLPEEWGIMVASGEPVRLSVARPGTHTSDDDLGPNCLSMILHKPEAVDYIMRTSSRTRKEWNNLAAQTLRNIIGDYLGREYGTAPLARFARASILKRKRV